MPGVGSEANLGVCQGNPWAFQYFPDDAERQLSERAYMEYSLNPKRRFMSQDPGDSKKR